MNSIMMAPAYTITSSAATNGAPSVKKITATANSETTRYSSACTRLVRVTTSRVATTATAAAM